MVGKSFVRALFNSTITRCLRKSGHVTKTGGIHFSAHVACNVNTVLV